MSSRFRPVLLIGGAFFAATGYGLSILNQDTLQKAALRFGNAVLNSDTATLWTFVPNDERSFYGLDQKSFDTYWKSVIKPNLKDFHKFDIYASSSNGLDVITRRDKAKDTTPCFTLKVSGQRGTYFVPYMIACSSVCVAGLNLESTKAPVHARFGQYVNWFDTNKSSLDAVGIFMIRRGPNFPGETIKHMKSHFQDIVAEDEARILIPAILGTSRDNP
ncbi:MAG: hypothetical protein WCG75_00790 [Armatimonadota bacterium]